MDVCCKCGNKIKKGTLYECPTCKKFVCENCANNTKNICPKCYHEYELKG